MKHTMKHRLFVTLITLVVFLSYTINSGVARNKIALIIANSNYKKLDYLKNTLNNLVYMENILKEIGFDVIKKSNVKKDQYYHIVKNFALMSKKYEVDVALFYYTGHGLQIDGVNYIVPPDAPSSPVENDLYPISGKHGIIDQIDFWVLEKTKKLFFIDACRSNHFLAGGSKSGLANMTSRRNMLIGLAAEFNQEADENRDGKLSYYTDALVKHLPARGRKISEVMSAVTDYVSKHTNEDQIPEYTSSLGDYILRPLKNTHSLIVP